MQTLNTINFIIKKQNHQKYLFSVEKIQQASLFSNLIGVFLNQKFIYFLNSREQMILPCCDVQGGYLNYRLNCSMLIFSLWYFLFAQFGVYYCYAFIKEYINRSSRILFTNFNSSNYLSKIILYHFISHITYNNDLHGAVDLKQKVRKLLTAPYFQSSS